MAACFTDADEAGYLFDCVNSQEEIFRVTFDKDSYRVNMYRSLVGELHSDCAPRFSDLLDAVNYMATMGTWVSREGSTRGKLRRANPFRTAVKDPRTFSISERRDDHQSARGDHRGVSAALPGWVRETPSSSKKERDREGDEGLRRKDDEDRDDDLSNVYSKLKIRTLRDPRLERYDEGDREHDDDEELVFSDFVIEIPRVRDRGRPAGALRERDRHGGDDDDDD